MITRKFTFFTALVSRTPALGTVKISPAPRPMTVGSVAHNAIAIPSVMILSLLGKLAPALSEHPQIFFAAEIGVG